jgi:hypothetical protein
MQADGTYWLRCPEFFNKIARKETFTVARMI